MPGEEFMGAMLGGAGISAAGSLASSALGMWGAERQMKFQERMSSTAYQRMTEDMRKAGINPMLAIGKASGASTPSGASYQPENPLKEVPGAIGKATELKLTSARLANETATTNAAVAETNARTRLLQEQANSAAIDTQLKGAELGRQPDVARSLAATIDNTLKDTEWKAAQITTSGAMADELRERARRERQIADALQAVVPLLVKGGNDLKRFVNWVDSGAVGDFAFHEVQDAKAAVRDMVTFRAVREGASEVWDAFKRWLHTSGKAPPSTPNVSDRGDRPGMRGGY
jgi:hypothetical protein